MIHLYYVHRMVGNVPVSRDGKVNIVKETLTTVPMSPVRMEPHALMNLMAINASVQISGRDHIVLRILINVLRIHFYVKMGEIAKI